MCAAGARITVDFNLGNQKNEAREGLVTGREQGVPRRETTRGVVTYSIIDP